MSETTTGPDGGKQKLTRWARARKQAADLLAAKTKKRKDRKSSNQSFVDASGDKGQKSDSDIHHTSSGTQRRVDKAWNRASHSRGEVNA